MHALIEEVRDADRLEEIFSGGTGLLIKHSPRCWQSNLALEEVSSLLDAGSDVAVWVIDVLRHRPLCDAVAERLAIRHESPQAILLVDGRVAWHASHAAIKRGVLGRELDAALSPEGPTGD